MRKKQWIAIVFIFTLVISSVFPLKNTDAATTSWQKLDQQIQEIQRQKKAAASKTSSIESQISSVKSEKVQAERDIKTIDSQIDQTEKKLFNLESDISKTTIKAKDAANELDLAEKRVEERNKLLKTRVRLMYKKGNVQYIEVLLGSNSFSDFLQRFDALQKIVESDKKILEANITDKNTIEEKKKEIDQALVTLEGLYSQAESLKSTLIGKKEQRKVRIASLEQKEEELLEFKEDEEKLLNELAAKESALMQQKYKLTYSGGKFAWPVPASHRITSNFGMRVHPITGKYTGHTGLDIGRSGSVSLLGADILAADDGAVILASYVNGYGNTVMIDHGSGIWTLYGHIRNGGIKVKVGQQVKKGEKIAEVGSTGRSTGPHLHFEVKKDKKAVSPWNYLK